MVYNAHLICYADYFSPNSGSGIKISSVIVQMTMLFLYLTALVVASGLEPGDGGDTRSVVYVDQFGLLTAAHTDSGVVQWTAEIGGPLVWTERLEEAAQVEFFPSLNGDLFVRMDQSGVRKLEQGVKDMAKAGETDFDWGYYFLGSVSTTSFTIPIPSSDCPSLQLDRITYSLSFIEEGSIQAVSRISVSELVVTSCLEPATVEGLKYGAVVVLGEYGCEEEGRWVYVLSIAGFVALALYVGFRLGRNKGETEAVFCVDTCKISLPKTAATTASSTPSRSAKNSPQPPLHRGKTDLTVMTTRYVRNDSREQETPLIHSSDVRIKDIISNGRFKNTFECLGLLYERDGQRVYEARHILEGRRYLVKVAKFEYDERKTLGQVTMFREVAATMRFRHKHIVNYVTSWVEDAASGSIELETRHPFQSSDDSETDVPKVSVGCLYVQSELVKGNSLKSKLTNRQSVNRQENCLLFRQILKGVAHIHSKSIVHRGLKPSCIYVTPDNSVKIGDFHLAAKAHAAISRQSLFRSGSRYSDPQCGVRTDFSEQRDIYPLGLILLEMSVKSQGSEVVRAMKATGALPLCLPKPEAELIRWITQEDPAKRPSAMELLNSLIMREWEGEVGLLPSPMGLSPGQDPH